MNNHVAKVEEMTAAVGNSPSINPIRILCLHIRAVLTDWGTQACTALFASRAKLMDSHRAFEIQRNQARSEIALSHLTAEETELQLTLTRRLLTANPDAVTDLLLQVRTIERLKLAFSGLQQMSSGGAVTAGTPIELSVSPTTIEQTATRLFARFCQLPPVEAERALATSEGELASQLPPYVVTEVVRQARTLLGLL